MITVLYDGKCGLCNKEIDYYKRIANDNVFIWSDITEDQHYLNNAGLTLKDGLLYLHAIEDNGQIHVGIDSFIIIWQHLPYWKYLAKVVNLPIIKPSFGFVYRIFAYWRFNRLDHCKIEN